jgi:hypothetical protein
MSGKPTYYTWEVQSRLELEFAQADQKQTDLLFAFARLRLKDEQARELTQHGFMRRLGTLRRCIENVFSIIPLDTAVVPDRPTLHDAQINIQAFFANLYGSIDNLAWIWVHERGLATTIGWNRVGFRSHHIEVRSSLSPEFQDYLKTLDEWLEYVIEYRDALAHGIPLYIPPGFLPKENLDAYNTLNTAMHEALNVRFDGFEYDRLAAEQERLLIFQPLITHSVRETTNVFRFHIQMLADFNIVEEIGYKMLHELASLLDP